MIFWAGEAGGDGFGPQNEISLSLRNNGRIGIFSTGEGKWVNGNVIDGLWHHAVFVWGDGGTIKLYLDGVLATSDNHTLSTSLPVAKLGRPDHTYKSRFFNGSIDQVRIFKSPINSSLALRLYEDGIPRLPF